jgi:hypothetical protein
MHTDAVPQQILANATAASIAVPPAFNTPSISGNRLLSHRHSVPRVNRPPLSSTFAQEMAALGSQRFTYLKFQI